MIDSRMAAEQLGRLSGLDFFPKEKPAQKELRLAIEIAATEGIAERIVSDWLRYNTVSPKPSELRHLCYDENERHKQNLARCERCGGSGFTTVHKLVTYHGRSFKVKRSETLSVSDNPRELAERIASQPIGDDHQQVLSTAKECECRRCHQAL